MLVATRAMQAACWALAQAAATTWYAEFLPSYGRGPLLAAVSVGWPPCSYPKGRALYPGRRASRAAGLAPAPRDIPPIHSAR